VNWASSSPSLSRERATPSAASSLESTERGRHTMRLAVTEPKRGRRKDTIQGRVGQGANRREKREKEE